MLIVNFLFIFILNLIIANFYLMKLVILFLVLSYISCISFNFTINGNANRCFGDHIPKDTLSNHFSFISSYL